MRTMFLRMPIYYPVDRIPSKWEKKNKVTLRNKKRRQSTPNLPSFNLHACISRITLHMLRHWKATMEYHKAKDILHVMKTLGHKAIQNTLIYIDLEKAAFRSPEDDEYIVRVAKTMDEACDLLEAGFEYVTDMDSAKIFRKRK